jgi:hypothetical protein
MILSITSFLLKHTSFSREPKSDGDGTFLGSLSAVFFTIFVFTYSSCAHDVFRQARMCSATRTNVYDRLIMKNRNSVCVPSRVRPVNHDKPICESDPFKDELEHVQARLCSITYATTQDHSKSSEK